MMVIRSAQSARHAVSMGILDPLWEDAVQAFADQLGADRVPLVRAIQSQLHVGPRA